MPPHPGPSAAQDPAVYQNPLAPEVPDDGTVDSCADPTVLRGRGEDRRRWVMFCTADPLNAQDRDADGRFVFHPVPMLESRDLVTWRHVGDALSPAPSWAARGARFWAPDLVHSRATGRYYLTFAVTDTARSVSGVAGCASDSAVGVATSDSPTGPWTVSDTPLVAPRHNGPGCDFLWTYDPDVLGSSVGSSSVLYYGSYHGGVHAQAVRFTDTGMRFEGPARQVAIANRYEGANVVRREGWYYFFGSTTDCCNGPLTGYSVLAGRSRSPFGPFVDREGNSLLAPRVGGTPVLSMNGNRWVGPGHNAVFRDRAGQWWTAYHAVDRGDPYFAASFTRRPVLLDPITWRGGWPSVRAGRWASDEVMPAPAAQPGDGSDVQVDDVAPHRRGRLLFAEPFSGSTLDRSWSWVRPRAARYDVADGRLAFQVQRADLTRDDNTASVLTRPAPHGDFVVQTKVAVDVPVAGGSFNFAQAGLVLYRSDDAFLKLTHAALWQTRQTRWVKEVPSGLTRTGTSVVGPPGDQTRLRVVKEGRRFTAYTSQDRRPWVRGGTWVHPRLEDDLRIGLVSMAAPARPGPFTARFDHVRAWALR